MRLAELPFFVPLVAESLSLRQGLVLWSSMLVYGTGELEKGGAVPACVALGASMVMFAWIA